MTDVPIATGTSHLPGRDIEVTVSLYARPNEQNPFYLVYAWREPVPESQSPRGYVPRFDTRVVQPKDQTTWGDIILPDRVIGALLDIARYGYDLTTNGPAYNSRLDGRIVKDNMYGLLGRIVEREKEHVLFRVDATGRTLRLRNKDVEVWDQSARTFRPLS